MSGREEKRAAQRVAHAEHMARIAQQNLDWQTKDYERLRQQVEYEQKRNAILAKTVLRVCDAVVHYAASLERLNAKVRAKNAEPPTPGATSR